MLKYRSVLPKPAASISRAILLKTRNDLVFNKIIQNGIFNNIIQNGIDDVFNSILSMSILTVSIDTVSIDMDKMELKTRNDIPFGAF